MLRNLDARHPTPHSPQNGIAVPQEPSPNKNRLLRGFLAPVVIVGIGFVVWSLVQTPERQPAAVASFSTPVEKTVTATQAKPLAVALTGPSETMNPTPATETTVTFLETLQDESKPLAKESGHAVWLSAKEIDEPTDDDIDLVTLAENEYDTFARSILDQPSNYYAVQLLVLKDEDEILSYAQEIGIDDPLYALMQTGDDEAYVLLLGVYPTYRAAVTARDEWEATSRVDNSWIRPLGLLQRAIAAADPTGSVSTSRDSDVASHSLSAREREIRELLRQARLALMQERLTSPPEDNAYDRYHRVLDLSPNHPEALAGIQQIVAQYLRLAEEYISINRIERAGLMIDRAEQVGGNTAALRRLRAQIDATDNVFSVNHPGQVEDTKPEEISVRKSVRATEEEVLADAGNLLEQNAGYAARNMLEEYLVNDPESVPVITTLFRLYLQMDDTQMAEQLIANSPAVPSLTMVELTAQLKAHHGDLPGAIKTLENIRPDNSETTYHALLASLYQQAGRFSDAASRYRRLLVEEPEQGAFWLGLAVSLDSARNAEEALIAFQRTAETGQYDGDVQQYIEERIRALSR